jgi:hypothetical protein
VRGVSATAEGVYGEASAPTTAGIIGINGSPAAAGAIGVFGGSFSAAADAIGVGGIARNGQGVVGVSIASHGVHGINGRSSGIQPGLGAGAWGDSRDGFGVYGSSGAADGVRGETRGEAQDVAGVAGSGTETGVIGQGGIYGVRGLSQEIGVYGKGVIGVYADATNSPGGVSTGVVAGGDSIGVSADGIIAVFANCTRPTAYYAYAGIFDGDVHVNGVLSKSGGGFRIDHPLDPSNKYLVHSFVESAEQKNIYDGVAVLNRRGEAMIGLPAWFEPLNRDFRYQLTPIGAPTPNLHIAEPIKKGRFKIAGGLPKMRVSWQVTGARQDAWARANPTVVEPRKRAGERGTYLHPELHGKSETQAVTQRLRRGGAKHSPSPKRQRRTARRDQE